MFYSPFCVPRKSRTPTSLDSYSSIFPIKLWRQFVVRTGLEPVLPGIQIGAINTIPHSPILSSTIPPPDQFRVTKENRTPIYRTTIYRVNRYTIATIFKPINVGLRCTLFNPLSHPSLLKSCQYRVPHLRFLYSWKELNLLFILIRNVC